MITVLDYGFEVSEFDFQSRYYVHFQKETLGKDMNSLTHPIYGLNSITAVFYKDGFAIKYPTKVGMPLKQKKKP